LVLHAADRQSTTARHAKTVVRVNKHMHKGNETAASVWQRHCLANHLKQDRPPRYRVMEPEQIHT
jgi:hypothetical protein